jgi:hypothetical protein
MTRSRIAILCGALVATLAMTGAFMTALLAPSPASAAIKICPAIFEPVCAVKRDGTRETFGNACLAKRDHARILHTGRCFGPICAFFGEVCARVPGHRPQTFSSACTAEQANATVLHNGPCK